MSTSSETEEYDLMRFQRMLKSAGYYPNVLKAVQGIFQRNPHLVTEMMETMEEEGFNMEDVKVQIKAKKDRLVELTMEKVKEICSDMDVSQSLGMSSQIHSYVAFLELVLVKLKADSSTKMWKVYLLLDYPARNDQPLPIDDEGYTLRTKLKKEIKTQDYLANVQADVDSNRIWMRVTTARKTKNRVKDKQKLENASPIYIAYYPGEPYYYMAGGVKAGAEATRQAMVTALGCQGDRMLALEGKSVTSLRMMRLGRDGRDGPSSKSRPENDRFTIFNSEDSQEETETTPHPILDSAKIEFSAPVEEYGLTLDCKVEIVGSDVIGGLMGMMEDGIICEPAPAWVTNLSTAGRNSFRLNSVGGVEVGAGGPRQMDTESVLSRATFMSIS